MSAGSNVWFGKILFLTLWAMAVLLSDIYSLPASELTNTFSEETEQTDDVNQFGIEQADNAQVTKESSHSSFLPRSTCSIANWWSTFDKKGWSLCPSTNLFIKGFYRSKRLSFKPDELFRLENAKCCPKSFEVHISATKAICKTEDWWKKFDKPASWATCSPGYFLNGLYRTDGHKLHNIEEGKCCKPEGFPDGYTDCYEQDVSSSFNEIGWSSCVANGYFVAGIYRDRDGNELNNISKLKCCTVSP